MSKNQSSPEGNAQQTDPNSRGPFDDELRKRPRTIPGNVLSLNLSDYSDDELAEMYESSRRSYTKKEIQRARPLSLGERVSDDGFLRYNRARGGPVKPEEVNLISGSDEQETPPSLSTSDLRQVITDEFGKEGWSVMKPLLATHATVLLDDIESSRAMMIEGQSGVGKTMLLKTFGGLNKQFCRSSGITPASFVSAGSSKSKDDPDNNDLLPQLEDRTLAVRDAQTLFTGSQQTIESMWRTMARMMDGDGYYRHTGLGKAGYEDIRFNFIGATTPLEPRAWKMMGNVGERLLFVEWPEEDYDGNWLRSVVEGGERRPIERGRAVVQEFLRDLWDYHGGAESVTWTGQLDEEVEAAIETLAEVVAHGRASIQNGSVHSEAPNRIGQLLHDLARGHALIHGRTHLKLEDVEVCGRVALSTMPSKRRDLIRALFDPDIDGPLTAGDVESILEVSRPTARDRIDEVVALGFGEVVEKTGRGGSTKAIEVNSDFCWPNRVPFPKF